MDLFSALFEAKMEEIKSNVLMHKEEIKNKIKQQTEENEAKLRRTQKEVEKMILNSDMYAKFIDFRQQSPAFRSLVS